MTPPSRKPEGSFYRVPGVLVDTPVWSLALRRKPGALSGKEESITAALAELIREGRAQLIGMVRQEILSGIRERERFEKLRGYLRAFEEPEMGTADYEEAARMHNRCRARGIAGSSIDFLICAAAQRRGWPVFTTDADFTGYARVLPLELYVV
jgi:hypothetical protein